MKNITISLIIPSRNEEKYIEKCLKSILQFEKLNDYSYEILIIDGLSTDGTIDIVNRYCKINKNIKLIPNPGIIQSKALNIGIKQANGDHIMRLDAHSEYPKEYFRKLMETASRSNADNVGGIVITHPGGNSYSAQLVQALTTHLFGVGNSGFRTGAKEGEADTVPFGFFKKEIFEKIGLFDEKLVRCQDYEFNRRITENGGKIWMNPDIYVDYFNQPSLYKFLKKQFLSEAPYNPYMWYLYRYTFAYRHAITGVFMMSFVIGAILSFFFVWAKILFFAVLGLYILLSIFSAIQQSIRYKKVLHIFTLPISFFLYHFIHGSGIWVGIFKLALGISPVQQKRS